MAGFRGWMRGLFDGKEQQTPGEPESFAQGNNDFAVAMYGLLRQRPGNVFFSPFSIRTALAMAWAGARGKTAEQMNAACRLSSADDTQHVAFGEAIERLNTGGGGQYEMAVANSLWGQEGAPLEAGLVEVVARHYGGGLQLVDFRGAAEAARSAINRWIGEKTRQRIRDLLPPGSVDVYARLVLANAVYFKGKWALQFREALTHTQPFHLQGGRTVQAPLMHQQDDVAYLNARDYQAVDLAYRGGDLSLLVLLPHRKDGLPKLEQALSEGVLRQCVANLRVQEIELFLPRFKNTWGTASVGAELIALGMPLAFTPEADFSGINGLQPPSDEALFISRVFHKALVEANEEGTEAAAATGVVMVAPTASFRRAPPPPPVPIFRADHPFLFAIRDRESGAILFLGRMADPTRED